MQATAFSGSYCWGHNVCLISQLNIMEQTASEICFCKWDRGQDMMNSVSNNLVDRIDLLALWPAELNRLTRCFTFSMIFLYVRMD